MSLFRRGDEIQEGSSFLDEEVAEGKKSIERWGGWSRLTSPMASSLIRLQTELARKEIGPFDEGNLTFARLKIPYQRRRRGVAPRGR